MTKFSFEITTRDGHTIPAVQISGLNLTDAENKLRRMYRNCEIVQTREVEPIRKSTVVSDFENLLDIISH